jgi:hypothetical protein
MEPETSLQISQEPAASPYTGAHGFSSHHTPSTFWLQEKLKLTEKSKKSTYTQVFIIFSSIPMY